LLDLIALVARVTGRDAGYILQASRAGDVRDSLAGLERTERLIGYRPRISLEEGLRRTWAWFEEDSKKRENVSVTPARAPTRHRVSHEAAL
jgi:nucleoside-diphosphate-sugar epimerase